MLLCHVGNASRHRLGAVSNMLTKERYANRNPDSYSPHITAATTSLYFTSQPLNTAAIKFAAA